MLNLNKNNHYHSPEFSSLDQALTACTHLAIGAHPDDIEVMAGHGILSCFDKVDSHFVGVTCTNGSGSSRTGVYQGYTDDQMVEARQKEQIESAKLGKYAGMYLMNCSSGKLKEGLVEKLLEELTDIVKSMQPHTIYTHNLFDKHRTHVAVAAHLIVVLRRLSYKPQNFYGCEVWRGLDWVSDQQKVTLPITDSKKIEKLIACHKSQVDGGKDYGAATVGRMKSNATFFDANKTDQNQYQNFATDLMPLLDDPTLKFQDYFKLYFKPFEKSVQDQLNFFC